MRILLVNYRYFVSGGPERYMFSVRDELERRGHEVIPFSIRYTQNESTPYEPYFATPLAGPDAVTFDAQSWTPKSLLKTLERSFYSREVERNVSRLIEDAKPDVAYVLHYLKKLSPSVLVSIKKHHLPLVVRISDFLMACPAAVCLRKNKPCTLCTKSSLFPSVKHRCVKGSYLSSLVHYFSWRYQVSRGLFDLIDRFVVPSPFTLELLVDAGWPRDKMICIPTFVSSSFTDAPICSKVPSAPYILYVGNIEKHKGVDLLIHAYAKAVKLTKEPPRLILAGGMESAFARTCTDLVEKLELNKQVEFRSFEKKGALSKLYQAALFTVVPSIWYENMPNAMIESYASGTAVLGAGHGSIKPLIQENETGATFQPNDVNDLAAKLIDKWSDLAWCSAAGQAAKDYALQHFQPAAHVDELVGIFRNLSSDR